jgi:hypothetical protein
MAKAPEKLNQIVDQIGQLSDALSREETSHLSPKQAKRVRAGIAVAYGRLQNLARELDPIKHPGFIFEPSNPNIAGRIIGITLIAQPRKSLAIEEKFYGSGVYAMYYKGDFEAYSGLTRTEHPVYVGKADPADPASKTVEEQGDRLSRRLNDHRKNIEKAKSTLRLEDFEYRALVVQTGYQAAAEDYLIQLFKPVWNWEIDICYGFGKHGDEPKTRANLRSPWDTLHPGRDWAHRDPTMKDARPLDQIVEDIKQHLAENAALRSIDEILRRFLDEMRTVS